MKLQEILEVKGSTVYTIAPQASLQEVVAGLTEHRVGSLVVWQPESDAVKLLGIITERDILHACMAGKRPLTDVRVAEVMTTALVTAAPDDEVEQVMGLMTARRIRHLPVMAEGRLVGIISIGDVVKAQHDRLALENRCLKDYITG